MFPLKNLAHKGLSMMKSMNHAIWQHEDTLVWTKYCCFRFRGSETCDQNQACHRSQQLRIWSSCPFGEMGPSLLPSRGHSGFGLSQWEEALHSNASSDWPSPYLEWSLPRMPWTNAPNPTRFNFLVYSTRNNSVIGRLLSVAHFGLKLGSNKFYFLWLRLMLTFLKTQVCNFLYFSST